MSVATTTTKQALSNRLRLWRLDHGLTLEEVAGLTGLNVGFLSRVERGERGVAPLTKVQLARRLGAPVQDLFEVEPLPDDDADEGAA